MPPAERRIAKPGARPSTVPGGGPTGGGGVQSLRRAIRLLEHTADAGGTIALSALARGVDLPLASVHRLARTLVSAGYLRQEPSLEYALGARLIRLGDVAGRQLARGAKPYLQELVERTGETANLAILDGDEVVYVAQAPSPHAMRMFTEVGRRVLPHCTAVGKALLAELSDDEVLDLLARTGMPALTPRTVTEPGPLLAELARVRRTGYAVDNGEQEVSVRCLAAALPGAATRAAVSVSGPEGRLTGQARERIAPILRRVATDLSAALLPAEHPPAAPSPAAPSARR